MDTTSNALSITLDQLAKHPEAQARLRREILDAQSSNIGSDLGYDDLVNLPYLDAVCRETLRLYVARKFKRRAGVNLASEQLPTCNLPIPRVCSTATIQQTIARTDLFVILSRTREDVVLPLSEPVRGLDGTMMSEIPIPKDTMVFVGVYTSNTRKALWGEDAYEWKPERWLSRLPDAVLEAKIPGVYSNLYVLHKCVDHVLNVYGYRMTFWGGGRACMCVIHLRVYVFVN